RALSAVTDSSAVAPRAGHYRPPTATAASCRPIGSGPLAGWTSPTRVRLSPSWPNCGAAPCPRDGREAHFNAEQNALVVKNAEHYYRTTVRDGPESWNVRDRHMSETLERLMKYCGPGAKVIVREHNTHIGDARFTDM